MNEFSQAVKKTRLGLYKTARKFWVASHDNLKCSYPMYMAVENGQTPSLNLAIKIIAALNMDEEDSLFAWMRSSLPDSRLKSYFNRRTEPYVVNQLMTGITQKKLLEEMPEIYELILYISMYSDHRNITPKMLSKDLGLPLNIIQLMIRKLKSVNILPLDSEKIKFTDWFIIPDNSEFRKIRMRNFQNFALKHLNSEFDENTSIQNLTVRLASKNHIEQLQEKIYWITQWFMNLKEQNNSEPYSLIIGGGVFDFKKQS